MRESMWRIEEHEQGNMRDCGWGRKIVKLAEQSERERNRVRNKKKQYNFQCIANVHGFPRRSNSRSMKTSLKDDAWCDDG
jgi:hypothetical protein